MLFSPKIINGKSMGLEHPAVAHIISIIKAPVARLEPYSTLRYAHALSTLAAITAGSTAFRSASGSGEPPAEAGAHPGANARSESRAREVAAADGPAERCHSISTVYTNSPQSSNITRKRKTISEPSANQVHTNPTKNKPSLNQVKPRR